MAAESHCITSPSKLGFMRPSEALSLHRTQIREIALRHRVSSKRMFSQKLRSENEIGSNLDLPAEPCAQ